ncbi:hypothetical protein AG1IA_08580 [Rhizoctonia solani AG-1 IA]|uniref:Uncharacterized protein n=1 Tax=Thanatephorus cucumeris (strain AG1-IA) TaxID=983506 RepID=L8WKX3_THACA|nr:hypothetical protein AG1IA_08580 [Rhizoctonia solani AG-1 IA]
MAALIASMLNLSAPFLPELMGRCLGVGSTGTSLEGNGTASCSRRTLLARGLSARQGKGVDCETCSSGVDGEARAASMVGAGERDGFSPDPIPAELVLGSFSFSGVGGTNVNPIRTFPDRLELGVRARRGTPGSGAPEEG